MEAEAAQAEVALAEAAALVEMAAVELAAEAGQAVGQVGDREAAPAAAPGRSEDNYTSPG